MAMTYVDALNVAINAVDGEVAEKLTALREQMAKKHGSSKPTKTQVENEKVKASILEVLAGADEPITLKDINTALGGEYSPQKLSALLRLMYNPDKGTGEVVKTYVKKVAYFALA